MVAVEHGWAEKQFARQARTSDVPVMRGWTAATVLNSSAGSTCPGTFSSPLPPYDVAGAVVTPISEMGKPRAARTGHQPVVAAGTGPEDVDS